ncbi:MAG: hypothetical protein EPN23_05585 [Verrucomicrobia bacterium]|nr:MAG: hypothetical protein EPN23_05585 [Verrucomicrobiota bacterium]
MFVKLQAGLTALLDFSFGPPSVGRYRRAQLTFLVLAFLLGGAFWLTFFKCKEPEPFFHAIDWKVEQQYYHIIQQAYQTHQIPYHVSKPVQPLRPTQRFMAVPESLYWLAPQAPLLAFLTIKQFVIVNVLLHFAIGFWGCLLLRRRFDLSPVAFLILMLLFNLNGHIIAHVAAGHKWNGYFYLSWFAVFVFDAVERKAPVFETAAKIALVNLLILLQGTLHLFALCMIFLGLLFVFSGRARWTALLAGTLTGLLAVFRLAPAALTLGKLTALDFESGYGTLRSLFDRMESLAMLKTATFPWEYDLYVGLIGVAFLFIFGIWLAFSSRPELVNTRFRGINLPLVILLVLSLSDVYHQIITYLPSAVPNTERVPSRFMILPLVFLLVIACARFQRLHQRFVQIKWLGLGLLLGVGGMLVQLRYHWALWRMNSVERNYASLVAYLPLPDIVQMSDPGYLRAVQVTLAFSVFVLLALVVALFWRRARRSAVAPTAEFVREVSGAVTLADRQRTVYWALAVGGTMLAVIFAGEVQRWRSPEGLFVTYYEDTNLTLPSWRGVERDLVRDFEDDPPVPWILPGGFSSRWTGYLSTPREDDYIFYAQSSDGLRFYLDGKCVMDNWRQQEFRGSGKAMKIHLGQGLHPLVVEHFTHTQSGALRVRWCGGGVPANTILAAPYLRKRP